MSITGLVNELAEIKNELKRRRKETKKLNDRKKTLENEIKQFLESKDQLGIKYQGSAFITESKEMCIRRKKIDKEEDGRRILEKYGIPNSDRILAEVIDAMRKTEEKTVLTMKKIKK